MFERHKEKKAAEAYAHDVADWQEQHDDLEHLIDLAEHYRGGPSDGLVLQPGESLVATIDGVSLVESRSQGGHWAGGSQGISVPIGPLRYRVGATRGHYMRGEPTPTAIDTGTAFVTDRRVVYRGQGQTRECRFDKLLGFECQHGSATLSVANRQRPVTLAYGERLDGWVRFRLQLAVALFQGQVPKLVAQLQAELEELERRRPTAPNAT
ncbi:MAG TPA: hypothetical protein VK277_10890 [Acidimicrobiales bacterium]|nr:hypothetical protein [Acidimicrobiales bacterium]